MTKGSIGVGTRLDGNVLTPHVYRRYLSCVQTIHKPPREQRQLITLNFRTINHRDQVHSISYINGSKISLQSLQCWQSRRVKFVTFGQKYLCRAYNVGRVVELNISVWVKNIYVDVEPTMLVESQSKIFGFGQKYLCRAYNVGRVVELNISVKIKKLIKSDGLFNY